MRLAFVTAFCLLGWSQITAAGHANSDTFTVVQGSYAAECESTSCTGIPSPEWSAWTVTETSYSTDYITEVETDVETATTTATTIEEETTAITQTEIITTTVATTAPITVTYTVTTSLDITLCETRIVNPTYTAPSPQPTNYVWGCPPAYVCIPPQVGCNFERGLPDPGYYCEPSQCVPAPALLPESFWGDPVTGDESPLTNSSLRFDITPGYFNMNPLDYDLPYNIFYEEIVKVYTTTVYPPGAAPTGKRKNRQAQTYIPAVCYDECNDALLEAQVNGKTPNLCRSDSAFEITMNYCEQCIIYHKADDSSSFVQIQPQFQQFINYCAEYSVSVASPTSTATIIALTSSKIGPSSIVPVPTTETIPSSTPSPTPTSPPSSPASSTVAPVASSSASSVASSVLPSPATSEVSPASASVSTSTSIVPATPVVSTMTMTGSTLPPGSTAYSMYTSTVVTTVESASSPSSSIAPVATFTGGATKNFQTGSELWRWLPPTIALGLVLLGNVLYL